MTSWTPERVNTLITLWQDGKTAPFIAERLGSITDSAVLKMKDRLGLANPEHKHTSGRNSQWNDERVATLRKLWAEGHSFGMIANEIGVTRCAAIGKASRLGLDRRGTGFIPRKSKEPTTRRRSAYKPGPTMEAADALPPAIADDLIPVEQRRSLLALNENTCRWPVGEPDKEDFFFCGAQTLRSQPYCACHSARAFNSGTALRNKRPAPAFDAKDDLEKSIALAFTTIRERVANGGPTWTPGGAR